MKTQYITKPDTNGNVYRLTINHINKTYHEYGIFSHYDAIITTHKKMRELKEEAKNAGYKEA